MTKTSREKRSADLNDNFRASRMPIITAGVSAKGSALCANERPKN